MARQRILLVDDHEVARLGLRALIERQPDMEVVAEAAASAEAITKAVALKPDFLGVPITRKGERLGNLYLADKRTAD